jgi:hypothetical protein
MFFSESKKVVYWNSSISALDIDISDYLIPAFKNKPKWFTKLKKPSYFNKFNIGSTRECPSFIDLFKNSLLYTSPCDFVLRISRRGFNLECANPGIIDVTSHTEIEKSASQMGSDWDRNLINIKISTSIFLKAAKSKIKFIYLPAFYHNPKLDFIVPPGIMNVTTSTTLPLNLNTFIDIENLKINEEKKIFIRAGDILSMIYFSEGIPEFLKKDIKPTPRKFFNSDYNKKNKK